MASSEELLEKIRNPTLDQLHDQVQRTYDYYLYPTGPGSRGPGAHDVPAPTYLEDMKKALRMAGDEREFEETGMSKFLLTVEKLASDKREFEER